MARPELPPKTPLAERLREVRKKCGDPKRDQFARQIDVTTSTMASYERGDSEPTASVLAKYHDIFGVNLAWLVSGVGGMEVETDDYPVGLDTNLFETVVVTVGEFLHAQEIRLKPDKLWLVYLTCYRILYKERETRRDQASNIIPLEEIRDVLMLAVK